MKCKACGTENQPGTEYCNYCGTYIKSGKKGLVIGLIVGVVVFLSILIGVSAVLMIQYNNEQKYEETLELGSKYLAEMNYEQAIIQYQELIDLEPENEDGYLGLANTYMEMGEYTLAETSIQNGIKLTNSSKLIELLALVYEQKEMVILYDTAENIEQLEAIEVSDVTLNSSILSVVGDATYSDYSLKYGSGNVDYNSSTGVIEVTYSGFDGTCIYYDIAGDGYIVNEDTSLPYANRKPNEIIFESLDSIFQDMDGIITPDMLEKMTGTEVLVTYDSTNQKNVVIAMYGKCQITIETDSEGNIIDKNAWNQLVPMEQDVNEEEVITGSVKGKIINAATNEAVAATIYVHEGKKESGDVIEEIKVYSDGEYEVIAAEGDYTLEIKSDGYEVLYYQIEIKEQKTISDENIMIVPEIIEGEITVVLEWGVEPEDLDAHISGVMSNGDSFYIYSNNLSYIRNDRTLAFLNPGSEVEVFTIYDVGGSFTYWVSDKIYVREMGETEATVKVYLTGSSTPIEFSVPADQTGNWDVFTYENGEIIAMY